MRPLHPDDESSLARFYSGLSLQSRVFRFFAAVRLVRERMVQVDYSSRHGIVSVAGADQSIVGHAIYVALEPRKAELALAVADSYQGRGLGTILLGQLAEAASEAGWGRRDDRRRGTGPAFRPSAGLRRPAGWLPSC